MINLLKKAIKFLIMDTAEAAQSLTVRSRYMHFRRTLLVVMTSVSMVPLLVTAVLSYYQYEALLEQEGQNHLRWNAESADKTIKAFLDELLSVMIFVAQEYNHEDLKNQEVISSVFARLKRKHDGLVDLGYIDPEGIQQTYAGPYDFRGKSYHNAVWFQGAAARGSVISTVFMGYRKLPHFVLAVSKKIPNKEEYWVLRASIDAETLGHFIATIGSEASDDIFLIDYEGNLQTNSRYFGKATEKFPLGDLPRKSGVTLRVEKQQNPSISMLQAFAYIEGTPWILALVKRGYIHEQSWSSFQAQLVVIVFLSAVLALLVILRTANLLGNRIREADEKREAILAEVEHTSKLASIGRLAAGVAHEINNPLAIISAKASLMKELLGLTEEFGHKEKFNNQIDRMQDAVHRCKVITHRLLSFARRMEVTPEPLIINEVVQEVIGFLDKEIMYRGIKFEMNLADDLPVIKSDRGQLQQILLNIVNNAIDASEKGGRIVVASRLKDDQTICVATTDNGSGMPPEVLKHIFEPFFTTKTTREKKGTGLGLSITYGLVKKLGGEISVESTVGIGTTFIVDLPIGFNIETEIENGSHQSAADR